ncbi:hypothetical protein ACJJTC_017633 [Scirpophaga incertulas]
MTMFLNSENLQCRWSSYRSQLEASTLQQRECTSATAPSASSSEPIMLIQHALTEGGDSLGISFSPCAAWAAQRAPVLTARCVVCSVGGSASPRADGAVRRVQPWAAQRARVLTARCVVCSVGGSASPRADGAVRREQRGRLSEPAC